MTAGAYLVCLRKQSGAGAEEGRGCEDVTSVRTRDDGDAQMNVRADTRSEAADRDDGVRPTGR